MTPVPRKRRPRGCRSSSQPMMTPSSSDPTRLIPRVTAEGRRAVWTAGPTVAHNSTRAATPTAPPTMTSTRAAGENHPARATSRDYGPMARGSGSGSPIRARRCDRASSPAGSARTPADRCTSSSPPWGVLPSASAAAFTASTSARLRCVLVSTAPMRARASAARIVPRSVRKSFAVKAPPVMVRTYALTSFGVRGTRRRPRSYARRGEVGRPATSSAMTAASSASSISRLCRLPLFPREAQARHGLLDRGIPPPERREPAVAVLGEIALAADARRRLVEQAERRREHPLPVQPLAADRGRHPASRPRQRFGQLQRPRVLALVPTRGPVRVIEVLQAPRLVHAGRLDVPVRRGADPDIAPGRGDHECHHTVALRRGRGPAPSASV